MVAIKLPVFAGMVPSVDPHLLTEQNAAYSRDTWLYSGALAGMPAKSFLHQLVNPGATVAFRIPINQGDPTYLYNSLWVEFENSETDFISAPVAADEYDRYYWTSSSQVPTYNTMARIQNGDPPFVLGVPTPGDISVVASGGVSGTLVSRAYVTTLVTAYGEEGPASKPFLINGKVDDNFEVTIGAVAAANMGVTRNVTHIRLYRTIVSAQGTATYYRVAEVLAAGAPQIYNDSAPDSDISSNPILESTAWTGPPDLDGWAVMPNGIVAGFINNELYFSEAYRPHAWPAAYALTLEYDVVGLAVIGQTLVVCTKGNPVTASGVNPASITTSKLAAFEPCMSKGSILTTEEGVFFTSTNGIIQINAGYAVNLTKQYISRDQWNKLISRAKVNAARLGGAYYAFGSGVEALGQADVFQEDMIQQTTDDGSSDGFMVDTSNANVGFSYLADTSNIRSVINDQYSGEVLVVKDGAVYWLDQRPGYKYEPYMWKSKIFQPPVITNFSAFKVHLYPPEDFEFLNPQNFDIDQVFDPLTQLCVLRIYADNRLILAHEIRTSGELHRLPTGFKADFWQIEIEAGVKVKSFQMATSVKELSIV